MALFYFGSINEVSGEISIQQSLEMLTVHVITIKVEARDSNAVKNIDAQVDTGMNIILKIIYCSYLELRR